MAGDFFLVLRWWGTLFLVGAAAWPLTRRIFGEIRDRGDISDRKEDRGWWDGGYFFSKAVGMAVVTWLVYVMGTLRVLPFSAVSIGVALGVVFLLGLWGNRGYRGYRGNRGYTLIIEEFFFFTALLFWSWIKAHEPSIRGLEKFMDFGFMKSTLTTLYFPAPDMWYAGSGINYYYFGHIVTAVLTKLSGIDLAYTFNLMLATIFACTLTMSFSIGKQIGGIRGIRGIGGGILTAFLVTLAGNMQTLYAFTKGYVGDNVQPFWKLWWGIGDIGGIGEKIGEGMRTYWYANATRFIPYTIHEFPGYSFVVSDVHGHVLSIPFVLLAIGILIALFGLSCDREKFQISNFKFQIVFYGFLVGVLFMTNALDGPIYLMLFLAVLGLGYWGHKGNWGKTVLAIGVTGIAAGITSLPFLAHFKSFVPGIAVNCPPAPLANTRIGPLIFEGIEKCQKSPLWMMAILWGFFLYCGGRLILGRIGGIRGIREIREMWSTKYIQIEKLLIVFFLFSVILIIFPEFFYFKDIYPMHFRSNTMFKLGYQAFILLSIVSGYSIVRVLSYLLHHPDRDVTGQMFPRKDSGQAHVKWGTRIFLFFLLPQLFLVSLYPIFSVRSYFNGLKEYQGIDGLKWLKKEYPDDWNAIIWLNNQILVTKSQLKTPVLVEADGDSYTDYNHFSAFTGIPTVVGWAVHEWLWRGGYEVVAPRREEVRKMYESTDLEETKNFMTKYHVRYVVVGTLERTKFKSLQAWKFVLLGTKIFQSGETDLYEVGT